MITHSIRLSPGANFTLVAPLPDPPENEGLVVTAEFYRAGLDEPVVTASGSLAEDGVVTVELTPTQTLEIAVQGSTWYGIWLRDSGTNAFRALRGLVETQGPLGH